MKKTFKGIVWLFRISRFPYYWVSSGGSFLAGVVAAIGGTPFGESNILLPFLWFLFPANVFLHSINDAYDSETDADNPRKNSGLVSSNGFAAKAGDCPKLLAASFVALLSVSLIIGFFNPPAFLLFAIWVAAVVIYNVPPFRLKAVPGVNIIFGGVGHYAPIAFMGYAITAGRMPTAGFAAFCILFFAASHIFSEAMDIPYDRAAGIRTFGVWLGSARKSFLLAIALYVVLIAGSFINGAGYAALPVAVFIALVTYELMKGNIEKRHAEIQRHFNYACIVFLIAAEILLNLHLA